MKEIFRIEDTLTNRISYYHIIAFMFCLPFDRFYSELVLISFLLHELIHLNKEKRSHFRLPVLIPALLYLLTIAGSFYSLDKKQMYGDLEKQLALLLFPLILSLTNLDINKYRSRLMKAFALSILATVVYLYFDALNIIRFNQLPVSTLMTTSFFNHNFSLPLNLHATYLSMFVTLSIAIFIQLFIDSRSAVYRLLYAMALLVLMMAIIQLSSKAVFIATLIIINVAILFLVNKNNRWKFWVASFLLIAVAVIGLANSEQFETRYIEGFKEDLSRVAYNVNVVEPRLVRWNCAWQLVKQSPLIGYGSGSEGGLLKEAYFDNKLFNSFLHELNAHNQYISFMIKTGIIGLAVYLLVLGFGFRQAIHTRDFIFCSFLVVVALVSFSENILDVNKGIFFFGFFYPFFMKSEAGITAKEVMK